MGELSVKIAGRAFTVACEEGQGEALAKASEIFAEEAEGVEKRSGNMRSEQLFLFAGLTLADKYDAQAQRLAALDEELREVRQRLKLLEEAPAQGANGGSDISEQMEKTMAGFAEKMENLVELAEEKLS